MDDLRGSNWRIWDLHVHTPDSIVQHYGPQCEETWDRFFDAIEALPSDFKVLGINDYLFLDGFRKLRAAKEAGRLKNIDLILPVVELRLDKFGGTQGDLSRVNFHVIFSDELSVETIQHQFLNALSKSYNLSPHLLGTQVTWKGIPSKESLEDLGNRIISTVPKGERTKYGQPLIEGFNNLNIGLDKIREALSSSYFEGRYLTSVGKTEWANIKWNDQSIADKKNIINSADIVFTASDDASAYNKAKQSLLKAQVNSMLFDCSDAHSFADARVKDRLGRCRMDQSRHFVPGPEARSYRA